VAVLGLLVAVGVNGNSTGQTYTQIHGTNKGDARLLFGVARAIRSDEWFVQTPWTISQVEQGLPTENRTFPGGMNATVEHDMPTTDWSTIFRPHLWGFFVLPLDNAFTLKWWLPAATMVVATYLFVVTLLPRRPMTAAALAVGFFFAPFFQWWYLSITFYPVTFALVVMTAAVWMLRRRGWRTAALWSTVCGYVTVATGMGIYAPYIIPCALVAGAFVIGALVDGVDSGLAAKARVRRMVPLLGGGAAAAAVLGVWALTRIDAIQSFTDTVYPGSRVTPPGSDASWFQTRSLLAGTLSPDLAKDSLFPSLGNNVSEASTFLMPGFFLLPVVAWLVWSGYRRRRRVDAVLVATTAVALVLVAFIYVPGWDLLASVLTLDRTTPPRVRIGLGLVALILMVLLIWRLERPLEARTTEPDADVPPDAVAAAQGTRVPWPLVGISVLFVIAVNVAVAVAAADASKADWRPSTLVIGANLVFVGVIYAVVRRYVTAAAVGFLVASLLCAAWVNPVYHGVFDLNDTRVGRAVKKIDAGGDARWVALGGVPTDTLVESGVESYSGFQSSPSREMWKQIDPTGTAEHAWNRLGLVTWIAGAGDPHPVSPPGFNDSIQVIFDSCASFAQEHVDYLLSEIEVPQPCLRQVRAVTMGLATYRIYRVTPAPASG
ncbi:MAG: hypothetical protein JWO46_2898, partial [Nocardioidaceae bacterium]|nr:hypothetical protein [Nocardioidaceae bacterium]